MADPLVLSFALPFDEAISAAAARNVVLPDEYYGRAARGARRAATTVSGLGALDQVQAVIDSVNAAIASGRSFGEWKKEVEAKAWKLPPGRLETIFRTNVQTAYAAGHWRAFQENKARRPFLMWSAINDARVRPAHLAMDGHIAPVDDPIWQVWHPPAGYNCRCSQISLTEAQALARGYTRQHIPTVAPDPGFEGGAPGDLENAIARARAAKITKAAPRLRNGVTERENAVARGPVAQGPPVSAALKLPRTKSGSLQELNATLAIIDKLHGDGALPDIPIKLFAGKKYLGWYKSELYSGRAIGIGVNPRGDHLRLTAAHEIGHFLDHKGWGGRGYSSEIEAAAQKWRDAMRVSASIKRLEEIRDATTGRTKFGKYVRYLLTTREAWARSYAQWVAVRSADYGMENQVIKIRTATGFSEASRMSQWDTAEFEPIARAIDDLFALLGWRKP